MDHLEEWAAACDALHLPHEKYLLDRWETVRVFDEIDRQRIQRGHALPCCGAGTDLTDARTGERLHRRTCNAIAAVGLAACRDALGAAS